MDWENGGVIILYPGDVEQVAKVVDVVNTLRAADDVEYKLHRYTWNKSIRVIARSQVCLLNRPDVIPGVMY